MTPAIPAVSAALALTLITGCVPRKEPAPEVDTAGHLPVVSAPHAGAPDKKLAAVDLIELRDGVPVTEPAPDAHAWRPLSTAVEEMEQLGRDLDAVLEHVARNVDEALASMQLPEVRDARRIAGTRQLALPLSVVNDIRTSAPRTLALRLCVSHLGEPTSVTILEPSGIEEADRAVARALMATWCYEPYLVNGEPVPVCERIELRYQVPTAGQSSSVSF